MTLPSARAVLKWLLGPLALLLASCSFLPPLSGRNAAVVYTPPSWPAELRADVYSRAGRPPAPAVLLIHGGSWKDDGARWSMNPIARALVGRGYVVVNASYRGTPSSRYPAPVEDLREAIRWMRVHAARYGIDPDRIATWGYSAGGHLAAQVALAEGNPAQVRAIVVASGPSDLSLYPDSDGVAALLGGKARDLPRRAAEASPVNHVRRSSPPVFIYHGTRDTQVPPEHALALEQAYRRQGLPAATYWLEGRGHADALLRGGPAVEAALNFLDKTLKR